MLSGKHILLIISGGIAAYKSLDLIRRLRERGCRVTPVLTKGGAAFVTPLSVSALAGAKAVPITQGLAVRPEFGKAIEALLGSAAEAISVSDLGTAQRILAQVAERHGRSAKQLTPGALAALALLTAALPAAAVLISKRTLLSISRKPMWSVPSVRSWNWRAAGR